LYLGEFHELITAQLAILIGIEFIEQQIRIRRRGPTFTARTTTLPLPATTFRTIPPPLTHGLTSRLSLVVAELPIAVGVEFFDHLLTHRAIAPRTFPLFLRPALGCKQHRQTNCQQKHGPFHGNSPRYGF